MSMPVVGKRYGRYDIISILGSGSFGTVFRAHDVSLGRDVALKVLLPYVSAIPDSRRRFLNEAKALALLHHEHIVSVYDVGSEGGTPYFTMELVGGETLGSILSRRGGFLFADAVDILKPLASAIDHVHRARLVHRDIKPSNIMYSASSGIKLMDFGIVRMLDATRITGTGIGLGTLEYASPEQVRGDPVGPRSDIYALGVVAYHLLAGELPFIGDPAYLVYAQAHLAPPSLKGKVPGLPATVDTAIDRALAKDPNRRPESATSFVSQLGDSHDAPKQPWETHINDDRSNAETPLHRLRCGHKLIGKVFASGGKLIVYKDYLEFIPSRYALVKHRVSIPLWSVRSVEHVKFTRSMSQCIKVVTDTEIHMFHGDVYWRGFADTTRLIQALVAQYAHE